MPSWLLAFITFLGKILSDSIPELIKQGKKPREVKPAGYDKDLQNDIDDQIEKDLEKPGE